MVQNTKQNNKDLHVQASDNKTRRGLGSRVRGAGHGGSLYRNSRSPFLFSNIQLRILLTLVHTVSYSVKKTESGKDKKSATPKKWQGKQSQVGVLWKESNKETGVQGIQRVTGVTKSCVSGREVSERWRRSDHFFCQGIKPLLDRRSARPAAFTVVFNLSRMLWTAARSSCCVTLCTPWNNLQAIKAAKKPVYSFKRRAQSDVCYVKQEGNANKKKKCCLTSFWPPKENISHFWICLISSQDWCHSPVSQLEENVSHLSRV